MLTAEDLNSQFEDVGLRRHQNKTPSWQRHVTRPETGLHAKNKPVT